VRLVKCLPYCCDLSNVFLHLVGKMSGGLHVKCLKCNYVVELGADTIHRYPLLMLLMFVLNVEGFGEDISQERERARY
jgi:hypothetical protein